MLEDTFRERILEAQRMITAFAAVGVRHFDVSQTTVDRAPAGFRPGRNVPAVRETLLPYLIPRAWTFAENLILRPHKPAGAILAQLDDLGAGNLLERARGLGFLTVRTSPGSFQVWMAIEEPADSGLVRRLVRELGADTRATCAGRIAGSPNVKPKYRKDPPDWPEVRIIDVSGRRVKAAEIERLVGTPPPALKTSREVTSNRLQNSDGLPRGWPDYDRVLRGGRARPDGEKDRSAVDFVWCFWALERGHSDAEVREELLKVSEKAREENDSRGKDEYARITVAAARKRLSEKGV